MKEPNKWSTVKCPLNKTFGQGQAYMGTTGKLRGVHCKNNCSEYKKGTCPKWRREE